MVETAEIRGTEKGIDLGEKFYRILIDELATPDGILASSKQEKFGCVFGRDTAITVLGMLDLLRNPLPFVNPNEVASKAKIGLLKLAELQGTKTDVETGEQPGKIPHEYRENNHERLTDPKRRKKPWKLSPDGKLIAWRSLDATPLWLWATDSYIQATQDYEFLVRVLPSIEMAANWITTYGDMDSDNLLEYEELSPDMAYGGLSVQDWADSNEYLQDKDGNFPKYPIAPPFSQAVAWLALRRIGNFFKNSNLNYSPKGGVGWREFGQKLEDKAAEMKKRFNESFLFEDQGLIFPAQALDGDKRRIETITGDGAVVLWPTHEDNGQKEAIVDESLIGDIVKRIFMKDMFIPNAGIRTMSSESLTFNPGVDSYHNGSPWLWQNSVIWKGLRTWGFDKEAALLGKAIKSYAEHTGLPAELLHYNGNGLELYRSKWGSTSCLKQTFGIPYTIQALHYSNPSL